MSVDTKEHLEGRIADSLACGKYLDAAEYITLLAQLIADEREAAQPEPAAAGVPETRMVVPEWFDYTWFTSDVAALKVRDAIESEISRRVAEATAERERIVAWLRSQADNGEKYLDDNAFDRHMHPSATATIDAMRSIADAIEADAGKGDG